MLWSWCHTCQVTTVVWGWVWNTLPRLFTCECWTFVINSSVQPGPLLSWLQRCSELDAVFTSHQHLKPLATGYDSRDSRCTQTTLRAGSEVAVEVVCLGGSTGNDSRDSHCTQTTPMAGRHRDSPGPADDMFNLSLICNVGLHTVTVWRQ